jgi:hypothetical protein
MVILRFARVQMLARAREKTRIVRLPKDGSKNVASNLPAGG